MSRLGEVSIAGTGAGDFFMVSLSVVHGKWRVCQRGSRNLRIKSWADQLEAHRLQTVSCRPHSQHRHCMCHKINQGPDL
jgi:hypothetical protein